LSGLNLLKVLLAERGLKPEYKPLPDPAKAAEHDAVLIIGDPAIDFQRAHPPSPATAGSGATSEYKIFDLGTAWYELTNLPFVFAVWALRRGIENKELCRELRETKDFGMETLDYIIETRTEYDEDFRRDYLGWLVHYHLASDEKRGIAKFAELLQKHGLGPVYEPKFVN
jgi:chorismate dehydratase